MGRWLRGAWWLLAGLTAGQAQAELTIYDDALRNGFENWSWGEVNLADSGHVHSGAFAIRFRAHSWQGLSFARPGQPVATAQYPELRLWLRGSAGGEQLGIVLQSDGQAVAQGALAPYIAGGSIAAGQYRQATVRFGLPPLSYAGSFDRIDIVDGIGAMAGAPQIVHIDDVALFEAVDDLIFAHGFENGPPTPAGGLTIEHDVAIDGLGGDRFNWFDSAGQPRSAVLAHNDGGTAPGGSRGGELRELRYMTPQGPRHVRAPATGAGGFGYVVSHPTDTAACTGGGDSSSLGHFRTGTFQRVFEGRHHAILRFTHTYPRYCTRLPPAAQHDLPITIDWLIANGRDHPLWSVTWDLSGVAVDRLEDDARAPYGELLFDGSASSAAHAPIAGVGWGDRYEFVTTTAPLTYNSHWTWNQPNTVPYVKLWTTVVDATMGTAATQTITQQDAGGYWGTNLWNTTSAMGNGCTVATGGIDHRMPCSFNWPYQSVNYSMDPFANPNTGTNNTRLAWGTNFGFLGRASYPTHGFLGTASGWPKKNYSTFVVLGTHSVDPVGAQVAQIEVVQGLSLTATIGSVVTNGPSGIADATPRTYTPAGYDPVYSALRFNAAGNALDANIAVASGTLRRPLLIVGNYSGTLPSALKLGGQTLAVDQDWLPSPRPSAQELWITLVRDLSGPANRIEILP